MGPSVTARTHYNAEAPGLPYNPLKALVAPRPIGWISTYTEDGVPNLAPYSFFNLVADKPKIVMFSSVGWKHSARNAVARGAFAVNVATHNLLDAMNISSAAYADGENEFDHAGLTAEPCVEVDAPMVAEAVATLECRVTESIRPRTVDGNEADSVTVFGQVMSFHIADHLMIDGRFDSAGAKLLSRLGYKDYATIERTFELDRP